MGVHAERFKKIVSKLHTGIVNITSYSHQNQLNDLLACFFIYANNDYAKLFERS